MTNVRPFFLVTGYNNPKLLKMVQTAKYHFRDIKTFETTPLSIGYVVKEYGLGYDCPNLDYICFSDPKYSKQDIIQCLGRGLRSDQLGPGGTNANKILTILLPTYVKEEKTPKRQSNDNYKEVIAVLIYLMLEVGLLLTEITFKKTHVPSVEGDGTQIIAYDGDDQIKSRLLDMMRLVHQWTYKEVVNFCQKHEIHTCEKYKETAVARPELYLPDPRTTYKKFCWKDTYLESPYYHTPTECNCAIRKIIKEHPHLKTLKDKEKWMQLHLIDSKIPNQTPHAYYGVSRETFII